MKLVQNKLVTNKLMMVLESKRSDQLMCSGFFKRKRQDRMPRAPADAKANWLSSLQRSLESWTPFDIFETVIIMPASRNSSRD